MNAAAVRIEPMTVEHLDAVMDIDRRAYPVPWSRHLWCTELGRDDRLYLSAISDDDVVGYIGALLALDDVHILTVVTAPAAKRRGVATRLMLDVIGAAVGRGATAVTLEVRLSNTAAQSLYKRFGMVPAGVRKGYYAPDGEDAVVMWARDIDEAPYQAMLATLAHNLEPAA